MFKRISFAVAALLFSVNAAEIVESATQNMKVDHAIEKVKSDVEKIAQTQFISAVTIPEDLEQSWEAFEQALEVEITRRAQIAEKKIDNTLVRYKKLIQQAHTAHKIRELAWNGTLVELVPNTTLSCDMDCVSLCFSGFNYRFENILSVDQYCLKANCDCDSGSVHYTDSAIWGANWDVTDFGTDRDLYDKNGTQIYTYVGDNLYHRDLDKNGTWLKTWHLEAGQDHPYGYRSQENYYEELNNINVTYMPAPSALYNLHNDCDLECSADCLSLRDHHTVGVVDACNALRCNCYFSTVEGDTCDYDCKASCLFTPGGRHEISECLLDVCQCNAAHLDISIHDDESVHAAETEHVPVNHHKNETHDHHSEEAEDVVAPTPDTDDATTVTENAPVAEAAIEADLTPTADPTAAMNLMGYIGYESYLTNGGSEAIPQTDLPLITISITFAVFMVLVLSVYFVLLKKEIQNDNKTSMLGYEDKNIYSEKLNFLENQEVCVSTL